MCDKFEDNELINYIRDTLPDYDGVLGEIRREAFEEGLPIIPLETARFISALLTANPPKYVLEIGCCVGFSASLMSKYLVAGGHITTIDRYDYMIERARKNFERMGIKDKVTLLEGHAQEILPILNGSFDFIFIDASKGQYPEFLRQSVRLLKKGGMLVFDDIFQEGRVTKQSPEIPRRQRTIHKRLNSFLWAVTHSLGLETSLIPIGDGLALCVKTADTVILEDML